MIISSLDLFDALKRSMSDADARTLVTQLENIEVVVEAKMETKLEKAFEKQEKIYSDIIKGLKEFITDKFATREDSAKLETKIADSKAELLKWSFIFWTSAITILAGLMVAILFKIK